ncbi:hypothetical protein GCM10017667_69240 [Streptomyces filamentosus]|uniref:Uncharacterized protein n=1 Tax=Streptomyces filamentosus TaxID=67294 RepID=A0A919BY85_STRFL|nr:hypothetical protein GCM10017667_69240 [Streptomyces filamentosus]
MTIRPSNGPSLREVTVIGTSVLLITSLQYETLCGSGTEAVVNTKRNLLSGQKETASGVATVGNLGVAPQKITGSSDRAGRDRARFGGPGTCLNSQAAEHMCLQAEQQAGMATPVSRSAISRACGSEPFSSWIAAGQQGVDGLDDGADVVGGASGATEDAPGLQLCEGAFSGGSEPCVVSVELLVVGGLFAVVVVGGAEGGAGSLVGTVCEGEDLPGEAGLDDGCGAGPRSGPGCGPVPRGRTAAVCRRDGR